MNVRTTPPMDKATFFRWLERQDRRHELVDGAPRMLPRVTANHNRIAVNVLLFIGNALDRSVYDIAQGDYAIETGERTVRYADVMVFPFEPRPAARGTIHASLLVEVLSDSTMDIDFGSKLTEYAALAGVAHYVVLAQDRACAWSWVRQPDGTWPAEPQVLEGVAASVALPGLGLVLPLSEAYRRVSLR